MPGKYAHLIFRNEISPLSQIPFHREAPCIERYAPANFPVTVAIHRITDAKGVEEYTAPHAHEIDELNILIGDEGGLEYAVRMGDEIHTVRSNSSIWIPAGLTHATNVVRGSGYYVVVKFSGAIEKGPA